MEIKILTIANKMDIAKILHESLHYDITSAEIEAELILENERIALGAVVNESVIGIIGAIPQYGITGWELHPLAVLPKYQRIGLGSQLIIALEKEVASHGGVMIYLGSDDEEGKTSLFGVNLYQDTFGKIERIENLGNHAYSFYEKHGYKIVGVFPDANGIGKPDIWLSKRILK